MSTIPVYYELSWSILSSIGVFNALVGGLVIGVTKLSRLSIIPVVVSVACAIANGMCYYAFYADYSRKASIVAGAVADVMWLVQEVGISFYSYRILYFLLKGRSRTVFFILFWNFVMIATALRFTILVYRSRFIALGLDLEQTLINRLHMGYFISIALCECVASYYLLRSFTKVHKHSMRHLSRSAFVAQLIMSTEIRMGAFCFIGITRAVTYSFQDGAQQADSVASQIDRFAYTMECLFPVILMIDLLVSRLASQTSTHIPSYRRSRGDEPNQAEDVDQEFAAVQERFRSSVMSHDFVLLQPEPTLRNSIGAGTKEMP